MLHRKRSDLVLGKNMHTVDCTHGCIQGLVHTSVKVTKPLKDGLPLHFVFDALSFGIHFSLFLLLATGR